MHSPSSIGPQILYQTTAGLHRKSFSSPKFGEKNPYLGGKCSEFQSYISLVNGIILPC